MAGILDTILGAININNMTLQCLLLILLED
jgi:hypothetical protein